MIKAVQSPRLQLYQSNLQEPGESPALLVDSIMCDNKIPIDGEFGLDYHVHVMRKMIEQLPPKMAKPFGEQLDSIIEALKNRGDIIRESIGDSLDDARLAVNVLEFDLQATRRERDELQSRLDDLS